MTMKYFYFDGNHGEKYRAFYCDGEVIIEQLSIAPSRQEADQWTTYKIVHNLELYAILSLRQIDPDVDQSSG